MGTVAFSDRVIRRAAALRSPIAVGLDPRPGLLPPYLQRAGSLSPRALARAMDLFAEIVCEAVAGVVPVLKIQVAFYEALGIRASRSYGRAIRIAKDHGLIVIGDVKRGDVGSTAEAYAEAHFGDVASSVRMDADAVTLSPYLGFDAVAPFIPFVRDAGKGLYLLVRTSNPSAPELQDRQLTDQRRVFEHVADLVEGWGRCALGEASYSSLGMVVGATYPHELSMLKERHPKSLFLVPGFGAQGGSSESIASAFRADAFDFLVASSREILKAAATRDHSRTECVAAVRAAAESMRASLMTALELRSERRTT